MMNNLRRKLRSRGGATMILALMFLLFCSFVGGSVLVSATANAYRVAHLNEQQDFLNQRSAALLLGDELELEPNEWFRLYVTDATLSVQEMEKMDGGVFQPEGTPEEERQIVFQLDTNDHDVTPLQQLALEMTVWRHLKEEMEIGKTYTVKLVNFGEDVQSLADFSYKYPGMTLATTNGISTVTLVEGDTTPVEGTMTVSGSWMPKNGGAAVTLPNYPATFSCGVGEELYDFHVSFGELSQLRLTMNAFYGGGSAPVEVMGTVTEDSSSSTGYSRTTTISTQTTISWDAPIIEKGGAEA